MIRKGDIEHVRGFLDRLNLSNFAEPTRFAQALDRATNSLARLLPKDRWGAARKFINIYLRNATYNHHLRRKYSLRRIEHLLELPLDSFTAQHLRDAPEGSALPRWKGVIHLTPEASAAYQAIAERVALRRSMHRVHLDVVFWRTPIKKR
jgi:hypothetical protein